jgi:xylulokinase
MTRAVMEGVSFALRDCLHALEGTGTRLTSVLAMGGGTRSRFWLETLASTLGLELSIPAGGEFGAALGAARLGMVAAGLGAPQEIMTAPEIAETLSPRTELTPLYAARWEVYRSLYPTLKSVAH